MVMAMVMAMVTAMATVTEINLRKKVSRASL